MTAGGWKLTEYDDLEAIHFPLSINFDSSTQLDLTTEVVICQFRFVRVSYNV